MLWLIMIDVVMDTAEVVIVVRCIGSEFIISKEMGSSLVSLKDTTKTRILFEAVKTTLNTFLLNMVNVSNLSTSVMVVKNKHKINR